MIVLQTSKAGVLLPVQAQPGARRAGIVGEHGGRLKVAVSQPPEDGKANDAIINAVAQALQLKRAQVSICRGSSSRQKELLIVGSDVETLQQRLDVLIATSR